MKLTKKKVLAGALSLGVVSSVGFAFASTDAGEQLESWYEGKFQESAASVEERVTAYGAAQLPGLANEYNEERNGATDDINSTKDEESGAVQTSITNAKNDHLDSLEGSKEQIISEMNLRFSLEILQPVWLEIQAISNQAKEMATNELTGHTEGVGSEAVDTMTTELNDARDAAVGELEEAIEQAKGEVLAEMSDQEEFTVGTLENHIDGFIREFRSEIYDTLLPDLVEAQQQIIADAAAELEGDALAALDDVVSGMGE